MTCICGQLFEPYNRRFGKYAGTPTEYCSVQCAAKYRPQRAVRISHTNCSKCGSLFYFPAALNKRRCRKCFDWKLRDFGGYPSHVRVVMKAAVRKASECSMCGSAEELEAHHIIPAKEAPLLAAVPNNIAVICRACHKNHHTEERRLRA